MLPKAAESAELCASSYVRDPEGAAAGELDAQRGAGHGESCRRTQRCVSLFYMLSNTYCCPSILQINTFVLH